MKPSRTNQAIAYVLLLVGAAFFLLPLAWMLSTALKPVEQTMSLPPQWLPRAYSIERQGQRVEVRKGDTPIVVSSLLVRAGGSGAAFAVPSAEVQDGRWRPAGGTGAGTAVNVLQEVPASAAHPWVLVYAGKGGQAAAVPAEQVDARIAPRWRNFGGAIDAMRHFPRYLGNTLILCLLNVIGAVCSSALAAYGFSRIDWKWRDKVFLVALGTMMIPFPVVMVPLYSLFRAMGWIGTLQPLWVGSFCAGAFNVFLLRQFFRTIPQDLTEAARIDGCSEFRILWQIIVPLCRPALVVIGLFTFLGTWNDFLGPLLYLTDQKDFTLALGLQCYQSQGGGTEWHYLMAASTLVILPIIVLFLLAQRSFIEGISMTGLKG
jgi:multiple sugar transport system permease protein